MTSILFEGTHAYLPEIDAYISYLAEFYPDVRALDSRKGVPDGFKPDVIWRFPGIDRQGHKSGQYLVHDYNSLSTGRTGRIKNFIKRSINSKPDRRVFLNESVRKIFSFIDEVPSRIRDMGVDPIFFTRRESSEYDFIYVGSLDRGSIIRDFLDYFESNLSRQTILLIGYASDELTRRYSNSPNIKFKGRIPYRDIPTYMAKSRYGLNLMPDIYPFNVQTSTKMLEYCAAGLAIVSSKYEWSESFSAHNNGNFFWLADKNSNLNFLELDKFNFLTPDVSHLRWNDIIAKSNVFDFLE